MAAEHGTCSYCGTHISAADVESLQTELTDHEEGCDANPTLGR